MSGLFFEGRGGVPRASEGFAMDGAEVWRSLRGGWGGRPRELGGGSDEAPVTLVGGRGVFVVWR